MSILVGPFISIIKNGYQFPDQQKGALISLAENNCDGWILNGILDCRDKRESTRRSSIS